MKLNLFYTNPGTRVPMEGELKGLKIAIQPNISVAGWPTDAGSKALLDFKALEDATIVSRVCQAGAFLCGSTPMSEFGFGLKESYAGIALKNEAADAELVMDMTGESRMAAVNAGVFGFKPSYGLVSRLGLIGLIPSMECCGILSDNLSTISMILRTVAGPDGFDFSMPDQKAMEFSTEHIDPERITIGIITEVQKGLSLEQKDAFSFSVNELKKAGFKINEISLPDFSLFSLVHKIAGSVEASSCAGRYDSVRYGRRAPGARNWNDMYLLSRGASFGKLIKSYLFQGAYFQFERYDAYESACRIRARLVREMKRIYSSTDFLIFPAKGSVAEENSESLSRTYDQFEQTLFANVTGQPVLYIPSVSGAHQSGLQLAGPGFSDYRLLALGDYLLKSRMGGRE